MGLFSRNVYEGGWEANTEQQLIRRIESKMEEFDANFVENLLEGVKAKVKSIDDNGDNGTPVKYKTKQPKIFFFKFK